MRTFSARKEDVTRRWFVVDAEDKVVGRLATRIAMILRGKDKPIFTPHVDTGDYIVVVNAGKVRFTGRKWNQKKYYRHSEYPGGLKEITAAKLVQQKPEEIIHHAVWGMIPHNRLGRQMMRKLKIYAGSEHPHQAQKPEVLEIEA
ncbi:MAG TPA: 50S ribosomal protein L13 [Bacteroidetes bacterium]|nr:50S ribosomal protein L13 [Bacteroidota bacterium]